MLLVLSLPVTAACVVLGGAIWSEVLATYALLSLHGLIYTAIALMISTLAQKPVGAIVWSYIGVAAYNGLVWSLVGPLLISPYIGSMMSGSRATFNELPFVVTMLPFANAKTASSFTVIGEYHVPNWAFAILLTLIVVRIVLAGAGSALSPFGSKETKSLRIHGIVYMYLFTFAVAMSLGSTIFAMAPTLSGGMGGPAYSTPDYELYFARMFLASVAMLVIIVPVITCFGVDLEKKFWPDGTFRIRRMLVGTPSGGLPYLLALVLAAAAGTATFAYWHPQVLGFRFILYVIYALALVFASWSLGRLTSAMNNGLRHARTLQFTGLLAIFVLPIPFLAIADSWGYSSKEVAAWDFYVLRPLFSTEDRTWSAVAFTIVLFVVGLALYAWSQSLAKEKYRKMGLSYGTEHH
jgi:hypothetical protein